MTRDSTATQTAGKCGETRDSMPLTGATLAADIYRAPTFDECMMRVGDPEIRRLLLRRLHENAVRTVCEWDVGACRIDVAAISDRLHGYEIKSPRDSLARLDRQARSYGRVFDTLTLIADVAHLDAARDRVPYWWGLTAVIPVIDDGTSCTWQLKLVPVRSPEQNPTVDSVSMLTLLWCRELSALLQRRCMPYRRLTKAHMLRYLAANVSRHELRADVISMLTTRTEWRLSQ